MLIKLQDYKEGEIVPVQSAYDPKKLDLEFVDLHYLRPLSLEGSVEKGQEVLTFRGRMTSETELICGRCLKPIQAPVDKDFEFYYEIKGKEFVDATDDLRELLILDHSLSYVCGENCRGLCPSCGTNLNEAKCSCNVKGQGSLSQIKDVWNKRKKQES